MNQDLAELFHDFADPEENLPPELLRDPDHPSNDRYYDQLNQIKRAVRDAGLRVRPLQRQALLLHRQGLSNVDVAKKLDIAGQTVGKWLKLPGVQRLNAVIDHHQQLLDGPNFEHRMNILWRITRDVEKTMPKTAIAAIQEMNRMSGTYSAANSGFENNGTINIAINGELLPRGALDVLPATYESRHAAIDADFSEV